MLIDGDTEPLVRRWAEEIPGFRLTVYGIPAPNKTGDTNTHHDIHQRMSIELSEAHALLIVQDNT
jgi:hypothetical protein